MSSGPDWAQAENAIKQQFTDLVPALQQWGETVDVLIPIILQDGCFDLAAIKLPLVARVKKVSSFISKAFYRDKKYNDPFYEINDKVGTRLVLLTIDQIEQAVHLLSSYAGWHAEIDKNISSEIELAPSQFGYLATHIIVRESKHANGDSPTMLNPVACEIQIKTLLQHAYSEVSHSTVYKGPYRHETELLRKLARSMALMEAVDGYFHDMFSIINSPNSQPFAFSKVMEVSFGQLWPDFKVEDTDPNLYHSIFDKMYDTSALDTQKLERFIKQNERQLQRIIANGRYYISRQPILLFVAYLLKYRPNLIETKWEFDDAILDEIAGQLGISRERYHG